MSNFGWCVCAVLGFFGYIWYSTGSPSSGSETSPFASTGLVSVGRAGSFDSEVMNSPKPVLVYFYADW